jgi:TonB family protein
MRGFVAVLVGVLLAGVPTIVSSQTKDKPLRVGGDLPAPKQLKYVPPEYSEDAKQRGIKGLVVLELIVDTDGAVDAIKVVRPLDGATDAVVRAVKQWKYAVTEVQGKKVWIAMTTVIPFPPAPKKT